VNEKLNLVLGANYAAEINAADRVSPKGSLIYMPDKKTTWEVVYGEGFRDPFPGEIQRNLSAGYSGIVKPVSMSMIEGDYKKAFNICKGVDAYNQASIYNMYQYDSITTMSVPINGNTTIVTTNNGNQNVNGIEDQIKVNAEKAGGYLGFSYVDPEESTVVISGTKAVVPNATATLINELPLCKVKAGISYKITSMIEAALTADYEGSVQTTAQDIGTMAISAKNSTGTASVVTIPAATIVGLNINIGEFKVDGAKAMVSFLVDNLFDVTYYDANFESNNPDELMQLPRNYRLTLKMSF
jgi:outer membrane receptor protein involved in Fe transport